MAIGNVNVGNYDINIDGGSFSYSIEWEVYSDASNAYDGWEYLGEEVALWAGEIGDGFPKSQADSVTVIRDENIRVTDIKISPKNKFVYKVSFSGELKDVSPKMVDNLSTSVTINKEVSKTGTWKCSVENPLQDTMGQFTWLPEIGDVLTWDGVPMYCESIDISPKNLYDFDVSIKGKDMSVLMVGLPSKQIDQLKQKTKSATWRVSKNELDAFLPEIGDPIGTGSDIGEQWAEPDYYITDININPDGYLGYTVELKARHISVRFLKSTADKSTDYIDRAGNYIEKAVYTGEWQCTVDGLNEFRDVIGEASEFYTGDPYSPKVSAVKWDFINDVEYKVVVTADTKAGSSSGGGGGGGGGGDRPAEDFYDRVEVNVGYGVYTIPLTQGGWHASMSFPTNAPPILWSRTKENDEGETHTAKVIVSEDNILSIPIGTLLTCPVAPHGHKSYVEWDPETDCSIKGLPNEDGKEEITAYSIGHAYDFPTSVQVKNAFKRSVVEQGFSTYLVTISEYKKGRPNTHAPNYSQNQIFSSIPECSDLANNWRLENVSFTEREDSKGTVYTQITQTYQGFQNGAYEWNGSYSW